MSDDGIETDPLEVVRIAVAVLVLAVNIYILWDYYKDQPEWGVAKRRMSLWWERVSREPRRLRQMENQTVFEAIQVVDHARD